MTYIMTPKILIATYMQKALRTFTQDMSVPINTIYTYRPDLLEIRQRLEKNPNPLKSVCVLSSLNRDKQMRRRYDYELICQRGEYSYFYHSEEKIQFNLTILTKSEQDGELALQEIGDFFSIYGLIPFPGQSLEQDLEYGQFMLTYNYLEENLNAVFRIEYEEDLTDSYEGDLFESNLIFNAYLKKMIVTRDPILTGINIYGDINFSGSHSTIPLFSNSGTNIVDGSLDIKF